jgi:hypothetical protein
VTHCDASEPQVESVVKKDKVFNEILHEMVDPKFLKFNNSGIFLTGGAKENNQSLEFTRMYWDIGMRSFNELFKKVLP